MSAPVHTCQRCLVRPCDDRKPDNHCDRWRCDHRTTIIEWSGRTPVRRCLICGIRLAS